MGVQYQGLFSDDCLGGGLISGILCSKQGNYLPSFLRNILTGSSSSEHNDRLTVDTQEMPTRDTK